MTFYSTYGISYSILAEAGLFSVFLYFVLLQKKAFALGFSGALLFITRYTSGAFIIPVLLHYFIQKKYSKFALFCLAFLPVLFLTMVYFYLQFGSFFSSGYESFESFFPIHFFQILFDFDKGLLFWSPIIILSLAALLFSKDNRKRLMLSFVFLNLLIYGAWASWSGAWSFGNRFFVLFFPIYCIGLGFFFKNFRLNKKYAIFVAFSLSLYSLLLFCFFMAQRDLIFDPTTISDTIDFWFVNGNLGSLPIELLKKTSIYRLLFKI
jgi:hypothetical protein